MEFFISVSVFAVIWCTIVFIAYKIGYADGKEALKIPSRQKKTRENAQRQEPLEQRRVSAILQNIDSYDGTCLGQREV